MFKDEKLNGRVVSYAQRSASPLHSSDCAFFTLSSKFAVVENKRATQGASISGSQLELILANS